MGINGNLRELTGIYGNKQE